MLIVGLDTTTRAGSVAVGAGGRVLAAATGDATRTHGERLPGDLLRLLQTAGVSLGNVDVYAVCSGPGSFTGLRVGLATIQGFALAAGRPVTPVPTLEVLAYAAWRDEGTNPETLVVPWMNAQRGEIFAAAYRPRHDGTLALVHDAVVGTAEGVLATLDDTLAAGPVLFVGDGVEGTRAALEACAGGGRRLVARMPDLAATLVWLAGTVHASTRMPPHAIRPVYVRKSDAELARARRAAVGPTAATRS